MSAGRILVIDRRAVMATEICRTLGRRGFEVDVAGEPFSPAFRSRWCARHFLSPGVRPRERFLSFIVPIVEKNRYDAIFVCNEEVLESLHEEAQNQFWKGLLLTPAPTLKIALSRKAVGRLAAEIGLDTPRTVALTDESQVVPIGVEMGFPLLVKGDRGEAGNHVRMVGDIGGLLPAYREIAQLESGEKPVLQEFVRGVAFSVGGLFDRGQPVRVCAHRKVVGVPPLNGLTAKGITERPPGLLEAAFKIFAALGYTGLGHTEFIRDNRGRFHFLEVNPRVWGTFAVAGYAGVDLFGPYLDMARGVDVKPDLTFREGVSFHRTLRELRLLRNRPAALFRVLKDCLDPSVHSDFEWTDPFPHIAAFSGRGLRAWGMRARVQPGQA